PTQTIQETIDGLETVRQMFEEGLIQSAFWHRYAMTVHSPSGKHPESFGAKLLENKPGSFANNEIPFTDGQHIDLDMLGEGLRKATYNYMHGLCLDWPVHKWFQGKVPKTKVSRNYIGKYLE
ncbi:MAG TPA: radical SAM protein, partial [Bacteroidales bacterium]